MRLGRCRPASRLCRETASSTSPGPRPATSRAPAEPRWDAADWTSIPSVWRTSKCCGARRPGGAGSAALFLPHGFLADGQHLFRHLRLRWTPESAQEQHRQSWRRVAPDARWQGGARQPDYGKGGPAADGFGPMASAARSASPSTLQEACGKSKWARRGATSSRRSREAPINGWPLVSTATSTAGNIPGHETRPDLRAARGVLEPPSSTPTSMMLLFRRSVSGWPARPFSAGLTSRALIPRHLSMHPRLPHDLREERFPLGGRLREVEQGPTVRCGCSRCGQGRSCGRSLAQG